jgi:hypothetical protein
MGDRRVDASDVDNSALRLALAAGFEGVVRELMGDARVRQMYEVQMGSKRKGVSGRGMNGDGKGGLEESGGGDEDGEEGDGEEGEEGSGSEGRVESEYEIDYGDDDDDNCVDDDEDEEDIGFLDDLEDDSPSDTLHPTSSSTSTSTA